ncbi:MAG: hypothetical protein ACQEQV_10405 [Fibrobacterota bacterium]
MDIAVIDRLDYLFRNFHLEEGHRRFLECAGEISQQLSEEDRAVFSQYLLIYEDAFKAQDVVKILDVVNFLIRPILVDAS